MLEIVVGIILALSLLGNYHQQSQLVEARQELDHWQEVANQNKNEWLKLIEIGESNANVLDDLEQAILDCESRNADTIKRVNDFREASVFKDAAIKDLRARLDSVDFGTCRVPTWVDFSATGNTD